MKAVLLAALLSAILHLVDTSAAAAPSTAPPSAAVISNAVTTSSPEALTSQATTTNSHSATPAHSQTTPAAATLGAQQTSAASGSKQTSTTLGDPNISNALGDPQTSASSGDQETSSTSGDQNTSTSSGNQQTSGDQNSSTESGDQQSPTTSGYTKAAASSGDRQTSSSALGQKTPTASGNQRPSATSGDQQTSTASGAQPNSPTSGGGGQQTPSPSVTERPSSSSNSKPGAGLPQTWAHSIANALGSLVNSIGSTADPSGQHGAVSWSEALGKLLAGLPGVFQGLGGLASLGGSGGSDVSKILTGLFGGPSATGTPAWVSLLTQLLGNSSSSNALQNAAFIESILGGGNHSSHGPAQTLLYQLISSDVLKTALGLHTNSTAGDVLSALLADKTLMSSLSAVTQQLLAQQLANPKFFPIDPASTCAAHLHAFGEGLKRSELWALQMLDATGKPMAGLLTGQLTLFGDYDQCMDISHPYNGSQEIRGQFYVMDLEAPMSLTASRTMLWGQALTLGIHLCLPNTCESRRLQGLFSPAIKSLGSKILRMYSLVPRDPDGDMRFLGFMVALATLCALCVIGTIYGVFVDKKTNKARKQEDICPNDTEPGGFVNGGYVKHRELIDESRVIKELSDHLMKRKVAGSGNAGSEAETSFTHSVDPVDLTAIPVKESETGAANGERKDDVERSDDDDGRDRTSALKASEEESLPSKLLLSFSVLRNGRKLLDCTQHQTDIACLHGIRVLSITWVILGHTFSMLGTTQGNKTAMFKLLSYFTYTAIPAALLSVDTFFLLSGCLTSLLFLRSTEKSGLTVSGMILYYWHRYWRLTPLYGLFLAFYIGVFPYLVKGPFQDQVGLDSMSTCRENWYFNILYINNLVDLNKLCLGWSWYLSNDMQFYFIAPICLIPWALKGRVRILGFVFAVALVLTHIITTWVIGYTEELSMYSFDMSYMEKIYFKPWCRVGPYAVGLVLGYILHSTRCKYTMEKMSVLLGWLVAAFVGMILVYVNYDNLGDLTHGLRWGAFGTASYDALAKVGWALCVSWVIFASCTGHGGFVNTFLSWGAWVPLSRLTYGVYLIHLIVVYVLAGNFRRPFYMDGWSGASLMVAVTVLSFLSTFVFSLLIEAPTLGLEKAVLGRVLRKKN